MYLFEDVNSKLYVLRVVLGEIEVIRERQNNLLSCKAFAAEVAMKVLGSRMTSKMAFIMLTALERCKTDTAAISF